MKEYYFGAWQSLYLLEWPLRFFIELIILLILSFGVYKIVKKIGNIWNLKTRVVKIFVWLVTEIVYLIGQNSEWAVSVDEKVTKWGSKIAYGTDDKNSFPWKRVIIFGIIAVYLMAVFVDLPIAKNLQGYYLTQLTNVKKFFQGFESSLSEGYEAYAPLFEWKVVEEEEIEVSEEPMYIYLNERGFAGSNIRHAPSLDSEVVGMVSGEIEILYQGEWVNDGERNWIKVYIPDDNIEGWLSGALIESEQLETIIF